MTVIKDIPFRIPDTWSAQWYRQHFVEVVAKADYQNGSFLSLADVADAITDHNGDPFSHVNLINAHKAEDNPHGQYRLPVGSIFLTADYTDPAVLLGYGTWALRASGISLGGSAAPPVVESKLLLNDGTDLLLNDGTALLLNN